jgi:predicted enzyme related to lactoylglutathione lyase
MTDPVAALFADFDRGTISRRHLLQALGIAAVGAPMTAFAQGRCVAPLAGTPVCDTTVLPPPFEPTGWKTVLLDHFHLQVAEPEREAAFYQALMGWKVRSTEGGKIMMDIGDWGGVLIRGGITPPPAPARGDSAGGRGGRGGGGGGRRANWDGYCWGIEPWDTATVEAELKKRGLNPVADHSGDFKSFHVKDPDGMDVQVSNGNKKNRRMTPATGKLDIAPPFESTGWKTVYLDHISFQASSYKETVAFYKALLGWTSSRDEGSQANVTVAPEFGGLIIRGGNALAPGGAGASLWNTGRGRRGGAADTAGRGGAPLPVLPVVRGARMDHISFGIADFEYTKVLAELQKRGLSARVDTGGSTPIETATYKSYHTTTPNGFDLQVSNKVSA